MMDVPILIRPARREDFERLCALYEELDEHHRRARPDLFRAPAGPARERSFVDALIAGPDCTIIVAETRTGSLLGFVTVVVRTIAASVVRDERRFAEIDGLVVSRHARRRGIARELVSAADRWSSSRGVASLELSVWEFNQEAAAFYEAVGFETFLRRMGRKTQVVCPGDLCQGDKTSAARSAARSRR
jgi:ribosomal protein S18 acetylase RimI-like enzyme